MFPISAIDLLGFVAGTLTTIAVVPQILKVHRTKKAQDLSFGWLGIMISGNALWAVYGSQVGSFPIIVTNIIAFSFMLILILLKFKHG